LSSSFAEVLAKYDLYARARGFTVPSINHVRYSVTLFDRFLGGTRNADEIDADDFRRFLADLREEGIQSGPTTQRQGIQATSPRGYNARNSNSVVGTTFGGRSWLLFVVVLYLRLCLTLIPASLIKCRTRYLPISTSSFLR
jgi:hypothetical protein